MWDNNNEYSFFWILGLLLIIFSGCKKESDIDGHWHLVKQNGHPLEFGILDIQDSIGIWEKKMYGDYYKARVDKTNYRIFHSPWYVPFEYEYTVKGDSLYMVLVGEEDYKFFGIRIKDECSLETDYFYSRIIDLELPLIKSISEVYMGLSLCLYLGKPKAIETNLYGDSICLTTYDQIIPQGLEELKLTNLKHDIKVPENKREELSTFIFADANVPMHQLAKIVKLQRSINSRKLFLVGKIKADAKEKEELSFLLLEEILTYNKSETVKDWIKLKNKKSN